MTYYVEPDYWVSGYAEGDSTGTLVYGAGATTGTATPKVAGNYSVSSNGFKLSALSEAICGGSLTQIFPGINLNSKSQAFSAGAITSNSNGAISVNHSDVRMTGRPFWEMTTPVSGTWTKIVPQAEGSGK